MWVGENKRYFCFARIKVLCFCFITAHKPAKSKLCLAIGVFPMGIVMSREKNNLCSSPFCAIMSAWRNDCIPIGVNLYNLYIASL